MLLTIVDVLGIIAFAISGVMVGLRKKLDPFGILIVAFVTATGGGTLRDLLLGVRPIFWLHNTLFVYTIIGTVCTAIIFRKYLKMVSTSLFLFDTIGLGMYTIAGIEKSLVIALDPVICMAIGIITACFGGVIRDILCRRIPVIFRKEIYATACIAGGLTYFAMRYILPHNPEINYSIAIMVIIIIRIIAVKLKLKLPSLYQQRQPK